MSRTDQNEQDEMDLAHLVRALDVKPGGEDAWIGPVEQKEGRLFGGLVLAQSVMAAGRTVDEGSIHSLHAYFLRPGKAAEPVRYGIERIRDGRTFTTRRVTATQDSGEVIFEASISFTKLEEGLEHQEPMPGAPNPDTMKTWWETMMPIRGETGRRPRGWANPIDIRTAEERPGRPITERLPHRAVWGRVTGELPEDPLMHAASMAYFSDSGMVATVALSYGGWGPGGNTASLDHTMWWHDPPRFDDWLLYVTDSPAGRHSRALTWGGMYNRAGQRVASVAQEGLYRGAGNAQRVTGSA